MQGLEDERHPAEKNIGLLLERLRDLDRRDLAAGNQSFRRIFRDAERAFHAVRARVPSRRSKRAMWRGRERVSSADPEKRKGVVFCNDALRAFTAR